jgi:CRP-like cAMP-binding protein
VSAILADVDAGDLQRLEAVGTESVIAAGQVLIERGHPGVGLYVIVDGKVIVEAPEGRRELGPGMLIGERALLSPDGARTARVRAATDVRVLTVDRMEFEALCADDPGLAERLQS